MACCQTGNIILWTVCSYQYQSSVAFIASACNKGDARLVLVAANCPEDYISSLTTSHPDIPIHQVTMVNRQLGAACAKPFPVSALCIIDPGQSELLTLSTNL